VQESKAAKGKAMKQEKHFSIPTNPTPAQLEERIVAWVLGEASTFEVGILRDLIATRPDLAEFKRRIEATHSLVAEAAARDEAPLRLSTERRNKLLETIGASESKVPSSGRQNIPLQAGQSSQKPSMKPIWRRDWFYSAAACIVICIVGFWMLDRVSLPPHEVADISSSVQSIEQDDEALTKVAESAPNADEVERRSLDAKNDEGLPSNTSYYSPSCAAVMAQRSYAITPAPSGGLGLRPDKMEPTYGYKATDTLAGTRIRINLDDVASSISVMPPLSEKKEVTNKESLLKSTTNTEAGGTKGKSGVAAKPTAASRKARHTRDKALLNTVAAEKVAPAAAPKAKDEEIFKMGSLEVASTADTDFGYRVTDTLAGTRIDHARDSTFLRPKVSRSGSVLQKRQEPMSTGAGLAGKIAANAPSTLPAKDDDRAAPRPVSTPSPTEEVSAAQQPVSTFSLHVGDASFKLALAALAAGRLPDPAAIRPEEFYNALDYGDPSPAAGERVSCRIEQCAHPFAQQRNLVRIALRAPATGRGAGTALRLTVLVDTSGSMERADRRACLRAALSTLVGLLGPADQITLVGFARQPRLLAEALAGTNAAQVVELLDRTPAEGGTNIEEALKLAGDLARRHFLATAQNRIVMLTDGAANLGNAAPAALAAAVVRLRDEHIAFDACGIGREEVDDDILEALTRQGDGRYYVLNSPEAADESFARQLAGAFRPAAENVKLQVRFNPSRVGHYRLVGFEKHRLREEDFRNDAVDAAELAAEEAAVAIYEVEALPQGDGELGEVFVRFREAGSKEMVERSWIVPYIPRAAAFDRATPGIQLAGTAAFLAEKLRGGPAGARVDLDKLVPVVTEQRLRRPTEARLKDLETLLNQTRRIQSR
jgi:Mg-chelatase subunit ChlD